jgi:hypothetical protein
MPRDVFEVVHIPSFAQALTAVLWEAVAAIVTAVEQAFAQAVLPMMGH